MLSERHHVSGIEPARQECQFGEVKLTRESAPSGRLRSWHLKED